MGNDQDNRDLLEASLAAQLRAGHDAAGRDCPDSDVLAAFAELTLPHDEYAHWEQHVAQCALCQRQLRTLAISERLAHPTLTADRATESLELDEDPTLSPDTGWLENLRAFGRFMAGPFPLSVAIHVVVLLFLILTFSVQRGRELIMVNLEAGGGGGGGSELADLDIPEVPMPDTAPQAFDQPTAVDTSQ
ncbi:MAG: hypothetical protein ACREQF_09480, partial [Candidatus Binataceae bacterium]